MTIHLDQNDAHVALALLGALRKAIDAEVASSSPVLARAGQAKARLVDVLDALLRSRELGLGDDEYARLGLRLVALGDQLEAHGAE